MTAGELIQELQRWHPDTKVYVDFDREGGNENQVRTVTEFDSWAGEGIKIE